MSVVKEVTDNRSEGLAWLDEQRRLYSEGKLASWKIRLFEREFEGWEWGVDPGPRATQESDTCRIFFCFDKQPMPTTGQKSQKGLRYRRVLIGNLITAEGPVPDFLNEEVIASAIEDATAEGKRGLIAGFKDKARRCGFRNIEVYDASHSSLVLVERVRLGERKMMPRRIAGRADADFAEVGRELGAQ